MAISTYKIFLMQKNEDAWEKLIDIKEFPDLGEISITGLGVVIGAHCGPGLLTVFYFCNGRQP